MRFTLQILTRIHGSPRISDTALAATSLVWMQLCRMSAFISLVHGVWGSDATRPIEKIPFQETQKGLTLDE